MQRIYLVMVSDGHSTTPVMACRDEELAQEIAARLGTDGSVESVILIDPADE